MISSLPMTQVAFKKNCGLEFSKKKSCTSYMGLEQEAMRYRVKGGRVNEDTRVL
jgi:hypothetical protein